MERSLGQKQHWDERTGFGKAPLKSGRLGLARRCPTFVYSPVLLLLLISFLTSHDFYPAHAGDFSCFPCRCSQEASLGAQAFKKLGLMKLESSIRRPPASLRLSQDPAPLHRSMTSSGPAPTSDKDRGVRRLNGL